jgi:hypothetical protein
MLQCMQVAHATPAQPTPSGRAKALPGYPRCPPLHLQLLLAAAVGDQPAADGLAVALGDAVVGAAQRHHDVAVAGGGVAEVGLVGGRRAWGAAQGSCEGAAALSTPRKRSLGSNHCRRSQLAARGGEGGEGGLGGGGGGLGGGLHPKALIGIMHTLA